MPFSPYYCHFYHAEYSVFSIEHLHVNIAPYSLQSIINNLLVFLIIIFFLHFCSKFYYVVVRVHGSRPQMTTNLNILLKISTLKFVLTEVDFNRRTKCDDKIIWNWQYSCQSAVCLLACRLPVTSNSNCLWRETRCICLSLRHRHRYWHYCPRTLLPRTVSFTFILKNKNQLSSSYSHTTPHGL